MKMLRFLPAAALAILLAAPLAAATADEQIAAIAALKTARPPGTATDMGQEAFLRWHDETRQKLSQAAFAFAEEFPADPRRWDNVLVAAGMAPLFPKSFGADVETRGQAAMVVDQEAKAAW